MSNLGELTLTTARGKFIAGDIVGHPFATVAETGDFRDMDDAGFVAGTEAVASVVDGSTATITNPFVAGTFDDGFVFTANADNQYTISIDSYSGDDVVIKFHDMVNAAGGSAQGAQTVNVDYTFIKKLAS